MSQLFNDMVVASLYDELGRTGREQRACELHILGSPNGHHESEVCFVVAHSLHPDHQIEQRGVSTQYSVDERERVGGILRNLIAKLGIAGFHEFVFLSFVLGIADGAFYS